jgi:WD40 repeat protein
MDDYSIFEAALLTASSEAVPSQEQLVLLLKGIVLSLKQDSSPRAVELLASAALTCPLPEIASLCITILSEMALNQSQTAVDQLFNLAIEKNKDQAVKEILSSKTTLLPSLAWQPVIFTLLFLPAALSIPAETLDLLTSGYRTCSTSARQAITRRAANIPLLSHWLLIISLVIENEAGQLPAFLRQYPEFSQDEKTLSIRALAESAAGSSGLASDALCQLFILYEDGPALSIVRQNNYAPEDAIQRAAFLFLSENWEQYQQFDYNHSLIALAYENGSDPLRKRLLNLSRQSGINDWLSNLSRQSTTRWLADMNDEDWIETISLSKRHQLWAELWKLARVAPPIWAQQILTELSHNAWTPEEDADYFTSISSLAKACGTALFEIRKEKIQHSPDKSITCMVTDPANHYLAAGTKDNSILLWDLSAGMEPLPSLQGPTAMTRALAISSDGAYLAAANIDNVIRIYKIPEGKLIKTLSGHDNLVRALVIHPDGRFLFSADFDGKMMAWRFPYGTLLSEQRGCKGEIYKLGLSGNGNLLFSAGACGHIHLWDWNTWRDIKTFPAPQETITHLESHLRLPLFISANNAGKITLRNYDTEKTLGEYETTPPNTIITGFHLISKLNLVALGLNNGDILLHFMNSGRLISRSSVAGSKTSINGLVFLEPNKMLAAGTSDGKVYLWNLFPLMIALKPAQSINTNEIEELQTIYKNSPSKSEKRWVEFIIALALHHKQYDIQIEGDRHISIGEFDILL